MATAWIVLISLLSFLDLVDRVHQPVDLTTSSIGFGLYSKPTRLPTQVDNSEFVCRQSASSAGSGRWIQIARGSLLVQPFPQWNWLARVITLFASRSPTASLVLATFIYFWGSNSVVNKSYSISPSSWFQHSDYTQRPTARDFLQVIMGEIGDFGSNGPSPTRSASPTAVRAKLMKVQMDNGYHVCVKTLTSLKLGQEVM